MIRHLKIDNFKSLANFSLPLAKFTCLVGLNGAGKTTLLQAIDFLAQVMGGNVWEWLRQREWRADDISSDVFFLYGVGKRKRSGVGRRKKLVTFLVELELDGVVVTWEGKFNVSQLRCTSESVKYGQAIRVFEVAGGNYQVGLEPKQPISFEYQGSILSQLKEASLGEHQPVLIALKRFFQHVRSLELLAPHLMRQRARVAKDIGVGGEKLSAFLSGFSDNERVYLSEKLASLSSQRVDWFEVRRLRGGWKELSFFELFKSEDEVERLLITEAHHVNDGLLRQTAILAQTMTDHRLLLFDEIENGMNQEMVEKLVDHLVAARQQIIVTTHSARILNFIPEEKAQEGVILLYRTPRGITRARRYFELPEPAEEIQFLAPGAVYADIPLDDVVQSALDRDREEAAAAQNQGQR
ncbi:MAG: AAA family ATPase [Magnetococcales bacterium]|nr:AAA family ATPase [Magnetococcales bacterium]